MLYLYYVSCVAVGECVSASVCCSVVLEHFVWYIMHLFWWYALYIPDLRHADVMYRDCLLAMWYPSVGWTTTDLFIVEFWGFMTAWNKGFVSPGLCSGMSFLWWWRAWIWYCSYGNRQSRYITSARLKSGMYSTYHQYRCIIYHTQNVQGPQNNTRLQKHTHPQPHTTHNIGIALTTRYIN